MGHEMGHYVLNHIAWAIALSSLIVVAGLFWIDRAGRWLVARYHAPVRLRLALRRRRDPAAARPARPLVDGPDPARPGLQPPPRARGRPVRPGADPPEPLGRPRLRRPPAREPGRPPALALRDPLAVEPPQRRRADRVLQHLPPLGTAPAVARRSRRPCRIYVAEKASDGSSDRRRRGSGSLASSGGRCRRRSRRAGYRGPRRSPRGRPTTGRRARSSDGSRRDSGS